MYVEQISSTSIHICGTGTMAEEDKKKQQPHYTPRKGRHNMPNAFRGSRRKSCTSQQAPSLSQLEEEEDISLHSRDPIRLQTARKGCLTNPAFSADRSDDLVRTASKDAKKKVSFDKVHIRKYERTVGDNPSVTSGPPIALGWGYDPNELIYNVDIYEGKRCANRRFAEDLKVPILVRRHMLLHVWQIPPHLVWHYEEEAYTIQRHRSMSNSNRYLDGPEMFMESMLRKVKRSVTGVSKKREMELLWERAANRETQPLPSSSLLETSSKKYLSQSERRFAASSCERNAMASSCRKYLSQSERHSSTLSARRNSIKRYFPLVKTNPEILKIDPILGDIDEPDYGENEN